MPSKKSARLAALTVAAVCSAASTVALTAPAHADTVAIHDIQGTTRISPYAGQQVTDVAGIVTGVRGYGSSRGFWMQDPNPDADPATSEGVFVFTSSTPKVAVGDSVLVAGTVTDTLFVNGEWVPAGAPVVAMLPPANVKVRFFIPESRLGAVKLGQKVSLTCDGCPAPVSAAITFIAPQAEYTPPVIYSKDSRAKLVFLAEARPQPADAAKLHPGQPVDVALQ